MRGATSSSLGADISSLFQSTLPMRGATRQVQTSGHLQFYFNPRSPCGERQVKRWCFSMGGSISIHAPHAGSDYHSFHQRAMYWNFNPRSPCGERPGNPVWLSAAMISIHAPHAGSDTSFSKTNTFVGGFQSTLPMRGATSKTSGLCGLFAISIHAPHAGSDCPGFSNIGFNQYFNPRSPCGERRPWMGRRKTGRNFNPRSPCGERPGNILNEGKFCIFQSTLPMRGATVCYAI